jgi:hypothetical protein
MASSYGTPTTPVSVLGDRDMAECSIFDGKISQDSLEKLLIEDADGRTLNGFNFVTAAASLANEVALDTQLRDFMRLYMHRQDPLYTNNQSREHLLYLPICVILNSLSISAARMLNSQLALKCIPHHTNSPQFITDLIKYSNAAKPDLLVLASNPTELSTTLLSQRNIVHGAGLTQVHTFPPAIGLNRKHWADVLSFQEVKDETAKMEQKRSQEYPYCFDFWGHQPGFFRVLYATASNTHYDIKRLDPVCAVESRSPWFSDADGDDASPDNPSATPSLRNLCFYVMSLYFEKKDERFEVSGKEDSLKFTSNDGTIYILSSIFRQPYSRRRTHVFIGEKFSGKDEDPKLIAIKISWKDVTSRRDEIEIIRRIHSDPNSVLPGVVKLHEPFMEYPSIRTHPPNEIIKDGNILQVPVRERRAVIMSTVGFPLNSCESILKVLMVLFDINECEHMLSCPWTFELILW